MRINKNHFDIVDYVNYLNYLCSELTKEIWKIKNILLEWH